MFAMKVEKLSVLSNCNGCNYRRLCTFGIMSFFDFPIYTPAQDLLDHQKTPIPSGPIAIFVNEGEYNEGQQILLSKIIGATGNQLSEIIVQQLAPQDIIPIHQTWNSKKGLDIIFGVEKANLMLQSEAHLYYPLHINERTLLFCDSLTILSEDGEKKKALWGCLKAYFEI